MTKRAIALIDYDNARKSPTEAERSSLSVQLNLLSLLAEIVPGLVDRAQGYSELRARFYGGWVHETGRWTERAEWMRTELRALSGRHSGIRVIPELAVAIMGLPALHLRGTARIRTDRSGFFLQQKMVDTMIAVDLCSMALAPDEHVIVVSDDDDLVPAVMSAQSRLGRVRLLRRRSGGLGCNDGHMVDLGVTIHPLGVTS